MSRCFVRLSLLVWMAESVQVAASYVVNNNNIKTCVFRDRARFRHRVPFAFPAAALSAAVNNYDNDDFSLDRPTVLDVITSDQRRRRRLLLSFATILMSQGLIGTQQPKSAFAAVVVDDGTSTTTSTTTRTTLSTLVARVKEARSQLNAIPELIQSEKWDSIRQILITPPLSECWTSKRSSDQQQQQPQQQQQQQSLLQSIATAIGEEANGDELAALELRQDLISHLRFLDTAVYNNVLNPIRTQGTAGATKELIRSYYEDPMLEYRACVQALDELLELATMTSAGTL